MASKLKRAIGAVKDHTSISLAKVSSNPSSELEIAILKATTHDDDPIDDKYVSRVLRIVSSNKMHAATCARAIGRRIGRTRNWAVALKSLMLVLRIFQDGDPYFPREVLHAMKRGAKILNLSTFRDDSSNSSPWDFTSFVRTMALYLDERLECFLTGKLQRRYTREALSSSLDRSRSRSAWRSNESIRDMKPGMLIDKMSYWQRLLDRAIATKPVGTAKMNQLVVNSFYAIVRESFDLYKDISDGLALILDSFFHLQYQNCINAFQICLKAVKQFDELNALYAFCKDIGVGRISEYPSIDSISEELIENLREFLKDQSSFSAKTAENTPPDVAAAARLPELKTQCRSLEELISATETGPVTAPSISMDLEAYMETTRDDMAVSETASTRSLPVLHSVVDLLSLEDWPDDDKDQHDSTNNWELALTQTLTHSKSHSDISSNTFNAYPFTDEGSSAYSAPAAGLEFVLYDGRMESTETPPSRYYNPFLEDPVEQSPVSVSVSPPTFQATRNADQIMRFQLEDPFAEFSYEQSPIDQNKLLMEQQQWRQNQSKIIARNLI